MTNYTCRFHIAASTQFTGGRLTGTFDGGTTPTLSDGDSVTVIVESDFVMPQLTGTWVFTAAKPTQLDPTEAKLPSPFTTVVGEGHKFAGQVLCLQYSTQLGDAQSWTFGPIAYRVSDDTKNSRYELTFVAADNSQTPPVQWSEDPEFDTGS